MPMNIVGNVNGSYQAPKTYLFELAVLQDEFDEFVENRFGKKYQEES